MATQDLKLWETNPGNVWNKTTFKFSAKTIFLQPYIQIHGSLYAGIKYQNIEEIEGGIRNSSRLKMNTGTVKP